MLVYKALNNLAPQYLSDDCQLVAATSRRQLRSSGNFKCTRALSQAQVHVWVIGLLLQPGHEFGTISQLKSVGLICRWTRSAIN